MKKILFIISMLFAIGSVYAQTLYTRKDTIAITQDSITLQAGTYRGTIQWQHSLNGKVWENLTGTATGTIKKASANRGFYRARITENTCKQVYSDTVAVVVEKSVSIMDSENISGATLINRDDSVFTYVVPPGTSTATVSIPINTVLVDSEKESDIRIVSGVVQNGNTITVSTVQGTMEDLFKNMEFKLTTATSTVTQTSQEGSFSTLALAKASVNIEGKASVSGGASGTVNIGLGAGYENGTWQEIKSATPSFTVEGPTVDATVNADRNLEVYPHIEVEFYSVLAPYLEIAPYITDSLACSLAGNYKYDLYSGLKARVGAKAEVLGENIFDYQTGDIKLKEKKLYTAPKKLQIVSGNNQTTTPGKILSSPVVVKVLDTKDNPVKNALVNFKAKLGSLLKSVTEAKGTVNKNASFRNAESDEFSLASDSTGLVSVNWAMADTTAKDTLNSYLKDATDTKIDSSLVSINAQSCGCDESKFGSFIDSRDGHTYKTIVIGAQTWMAENLAYLPYTTPTGTYSYTDPCYYVNNYALYGVLYNWPAALTACPAGWLLRPQQRLRLLRCRYLRLLVE
jgi:hypothetical protein